MAEPERRVYTPEWWARRAEAAQKIAAVRSRDPQSDTKLVMVAAQHPLKGKTVPGDEFAARLERGAEIFHNRFQQERLTEIYVPSSRHRDDFGSGEDDWVELADAGAKYLVEELGVPIEFIHGRDWNDQFMGEEGVYSSADEIFAAAQGFHNEERFSSALAVVSPAQLERASAYATANKLEIELDIPAKLMAREMELVHSSSPKIKFESLALLAMARWYDPDGQRWLHNRMRKRRLPSDGNPHTVDEVEMLYRNLPGHIR